MVWKDNAFGICINRTMNVDFAKLKLEGASFVIIEMGEGFNPNPVLADQCNKAKEAGLLILLKYIPDPAYPDYTFSGLPLEQIAYIKKWITGKSFNGVVVSIERNLTALSGVKAGDLAISYTSETVVRTLTKYFNDIATRDGTTPIPVFVRTNDSFVKQYSPSVSNWTDQFGFDLVDWRYRTRALDGSWNIYNYFKSGITNTINDILALFPTVEIKNPLIPGNTPQLKFWEYSNLYSLPYILGWDSSIKKIETVLFNGTVDALYTLFNFSSVVVPPDDPPIDPPDDPGTGVGTVDLTEVLTNQHTILANQVVIMQGINDIKSIFSKFNGTATTGIKSFFNGIFK